MLNKIIKNFLISRYIVDFINFFLIRILKAKKILSSAVTFQGKYFSVLDSDIFIVSYPKSGNMWLSLIVANLFNRKNFVNISNINKYVQDIYLTKESYIASRKSPRIFKSHDTFDVRFKKVIYIVRDPRDIITSSYFFLIRIGKIKINYSKRKFVKNFLNGDYEVDFGSWHQNVGSWYGARNKNIFFVKYENLKKNSYKEIKSIADFLNIKVSNKLIKKIEKNTNFSKQKNFEDKINIKKINYFRKGEVNQWKPFLSREQNRIIKVKWAHYMKKFNYI
mgnify:CR=1 FL=1